MEWLLKRHLKKIQTLSLKFHQIDNSRLLNAWWEALKQWE